MSITDELREYASSLAMKAGASTTEVKGALEEIADHIDQEHEECVGFARRLEDAASNGEEVTIFGTDYIPLPKDADGETIHLGDELDGYNKTIEVVELRYGRSGWVLISRDGNGYADTFAFTHHHEPTVEDVLREFAANIADVLGGDDFKLDDNDELYAEYAAKLRLAGEDE